MSIYPSNKKTASISQIRELVQSAIPIAEDKNVEHNKFTYFRYYYADVKYGGIIYPAILNVGLGFNDKLYHLYDITEYLRDTASRINGFERLREFRSENGVSIGSISDSAENVNGKNKKQLKVDSDPSLWLSFHLLLKCDYPFSYIF